MEQKRNSQTWYSNFAHYPNTTRLKPLLSKWNENFRISYKLQRNESPFSLIDHENFLDFSLNGARISLCFAYRCIHFHHTYSSVVLLPEQGNLSVLIEGQKCVAGSSSLLCCFCWFNYQYRNSAWSKLASMKHGKWRNYYFHNSSNVQHASRSFSISLI